MSAVNSGVYRPMILVLLLFSLLFACEAPPVTCQSHEECRARDPSTQLCQAGICSACDGEVCGDVCVDVQTASEHCGRCNNACPVGQSCEQGSCKASCAEPKRICGVSCTDLETDKAHCGQCDNACQTGQVCERGKCKANCSAGMTDCSGACVELRRSNDHCGACGTKCTGVKICQAGVCTCPVGQSECSGACVDLRTDRAHCGGCSKACLDDKTCQDGACACPPNTTACQGKCVDLQSNDEHCGSCANTCTKSTSIAFEQTTASSGDNKQVIPSDIAIDQAGNRYIIGLFSEQLQFGTTMMTATAPYHIFIASLDKDGKWRWANKISTPTAKILTAGAIGVDHDGNVYITGSFVTTASFGNITLTSAGEHDIFVAKLDNKGNWLWAKRAGGSSYDRAFDLTIDRSGGVYLAGTVASKSSFGSIPIDTAQGDSNAFVAKIDKDGRWIWAVATGDHLSQSNAVGIATDGVHLYLAGSFQEQVSFGNTVLSSAKRSSTFVAKLTTSGDWKWAKQAHCSTYCYGADVGVDRAGNVFFSGVFTGESMFGDTRLMPVPNAKPRHDVFVASLDKDGNWRWASSGGSPDADGAHDLVVSPSGQIVLRGIFLDKATFGSHTITSAGGRDVFVATLDTNGRWLSAVGMGDASDEYGTGMRIDRAGAIHLFLAFGGTITLGNSKNTTPRRGFVVSKISRGAQSCSSGACCATGYTNCGTGCVDTKTNDQHCGACGAACEGGKVCLAGKCACPADQRECAGACVRKDDNCSACGNSCPRPSSASFDLLVGGGGAAADHAIHTTVDDQGNVYLAGVFNGTMQLGSHSLTAAGGSDAFVAKLDSNGKWLWVKRAGGTSNDGGRGIAVDKNGHVFLAGIFQDTASFGSFKLTSSGSNDIFVAKLDDKGNWLWARKTGGVGDDNLYHLIIDPNGNLHATGYISQNVLFYAAPTTTRSHSSLGGTDMFVGTINGKTGYWLWVKSAGGTSNDKGYQVSLGPDGSLHVIGIFAGTASFEGLKKTSVNGSTDIFVAQYKGDAVSYVVPIGGAGTDFGRGITVDGFGNVYVTGYFSGKAFFGFDSLTSAGSSDIFVAKLHSGGGFLWVKQVGGKGEDRSIRITHDAGGHVYIAGDFHDTVSFGSTSLTAASSFDAFLARLDANGNWRWAIRAGGAGQDTATGVQVTADGTLFFTGYFSSRFSLGNILLSSAGSFDIFVARRTIDQHHCSSESCCVLGYTNCGGSCVHTQTSPDHCGRCNNACATGTTCVAGLCQ